MTTPFDTLVEGGRLVSATGVHRADLAVRNGRIVAVGDLAMADATERVDASGLLVLPGAVDEHVHPIYLDDPRQTSIVAAFGGVTTVMHFAYAKPGESLRASVADLRAQAAAGSVLDFTIHAGMFDPATQLSEMAAVADDGVRSFKVFLAYGAQGWMTDDASLVAVLREATTIGGLTLVHCENGPAIDALEADARAGRLGDDPVTAMLATRPAVLEAEATHRTLALAEAFDADVLIVHVTNARALQMVRAARERGQRMAAETCPQYLTLTAAAVHERGALAKIGPPLRTLADNEALWAGLADGTLQCVGSDHVPKKHVDEDTGPLLEAGFGAPSIETMVSLILDGALEGRMPLERVAAVTSTNPARLFGLAGRKGTLDVGADADLAIWDPAAVRRLGAADEHTHAGYSLHEGREVRGRLVLTLVGGRTVVRDGELVDDAPCGRFLPTGPFDLTIR